MGWLTLVLSLVQLAPSIVDLIIKIEGAITANKSGEAKKAVVMATVADAPTEVQGGVSKLIDTTVGALNAAGVFKKV